MNLVSPRKKPWPDVPRLLQARARLATVFDEGVVSSVTAFLAWKAFLITAKSLGTGAERDRCTERIRDAIASEPTCARAAARFATALEILSEQSNVAVAEWLVSDGDDADKRDRTVARFRREVGKLTSRGRSEPLAQPDRFSVAEWAFAFRNAVIAHGSVHSTGNLFRLLVPSFDEMVCAVACQGYSTQLGISFEEARDECNVQLS
jgi:hypothetical protein